ncbi:PP2C family serine/threonine-protein phosphatase [Deinococcus hopiensis]|uniref:PP2C family serine/threonine-protein phosphatase n=1 Tax=Deinococcus hopiensis TaxID=309885 RepID=UPI001482C5EC|nr:PP2C family serine/threonine-protein phosphatase [Deinococcus hopiensis]
MNERMAEEPTERAEDQVAEDQVAEEVRHADSPALEEPQPPVDPTFEQASSGSTPDWLLAGASVRGTSHIASGTPCQDAHTIRACQTSGEEGVLIAVVSDGAGSARHAEYGSRAACDFISTRVEHLLCSSGLSLEDLNPDSLISEARAHLEALADAMECEPRDLACTLLCAVVFPQAALFFQVGDGALIYGDEDLDVAAWPSGGEYANQTDFVYAARPEQVHTRRISGTVRKLAMVSDGLQMVCLRLQEQRVHPAFFARFFQALEASSDRELFEGALARTLNNERINASTDDDKTLVLALRA